MIGVGASPNRHTTEHGYLYPGLMVIDARISRNVVTVPYRRLHYGRDD